MMLQQARFIILPSGVRMRFETQFKPVAGTAVPQSYYCTACFARLGHGHIAGRLFVCEQASRAGCASGPLQVLTALQGSSTLGNPGTFVLGRVGKQRM